ncbi:MAG: carbohydrate binding family 9 domain-containing protein [Candidatus Omnitrophica bacterium]|nr:carbohydrate binding family 9 domain-containing protein [Candidatus Omnitrophota bacterium]
MGYQPRRAFIIGLILFFFINKFIGVPALSHDDPDAPVPSLQAFKTDQPINVDGVLDESFWADCEITSNFIDIRTQKPADQQTFVRIAYTRTHLYIGVECFDDNIQELHAAERREDRSYFNVDDAVEVHIDPTHSHRAKYAFFSNPLGTRVDANEGPSGQFNHGWSADWDLAASILDDRWVFEMSIPFTIMNYFRQDNQTWGLNFTRVIPRLDSTSFWSYNPSEYYKPRHFGHLTGLDLADTEFDRNWEITPYMSTRYDFNGDSSTMFQTGVDASFRLTPSITTSWTLNPDFGQVEADADTIELRDTERFLPEKRLFFREGSELLDMRNTLYYSRRFTDIEAGAKASGEWDDFKFSFLDIQGDVARDDIVRYGNSSVFRTTQNIGERSVLGYYLSNSDFNDGHSRVASFDGNIFLHDDWQYRFQGSLSDDRMEDEKGSLAKDRLDYLGYNVLQFNKYPWDIDVGYIGVSEGFDPVLGYIPRRDIFGPQAEIEYQHESDERWYKDFYVRLDTQLYENEDDDTVLRDYGFYSRVVFPNDLGLLFGQSFDYHAPYDNTRTQAGFSLFSSDFWKSIEIAWAGGEFEEVEYNEITLEKNFKPFERWPIRYDFTIRFEEEPDGEKHTVWLNRIVFDYYFTDDMWLKTSLQHRSNSIGNISVIYGWEFLRNANWYLVFNSVSDENDDTGNSIFTKIDYTF